MLYFDLTKNERVMAKVNWVLFRESMRIEALIGDSAKAKAFLVEVNGIAGEKAASTSVSKSDLHIKFLDIAKYEFSKGRSTKEVLKTIKAYAKI